MTTRIALEECSTLAGIRVLHQAIVEAFADPDPIMIDAGQVCEADFSLIQLLAATQIEAQRCGRELVWQGADNPVLVHLFEQAGLQPPVGASATATPGDIAQ